MDGSDDPVAILASVSGRETSECERMLMVTDGDVDQAMALLLDSSPTHNTERPDRGLPPASSVVSAVSSASSIGYETAEDDGASPDEEDGDVVNFLTQMTHSSSSSPVGGSEAQPEPAPHPQPAPQPQPVPQLAPLSQPAPEPAPARAGPSSPRPLFRFGGGVSPRPAAAAAAAGGGASRPLFRFGAPSSSPGPLGAAAADPAPEAGATADGGGDKLARLLGKVEEKEATRTTFVSMGVETAGIDAELRALREEIAQLGDGAKGGAGAAASPPAPEFVAVGGSNNNNGRSGNTDNTDDSGSSRRLPGRGQPFQPSQPPAFGSAPHEPPSLPAPASGTDTGTGSRASADRPRFTLGGSSRSGGDRRVVGGGSSSSQRRQPPPPPPQGLEEAVATLSEMGLPEADVRRALLATRRAVISEEQITLVATRLLSGAPPTDDVMYGSGSDGGGDDDAHTFPPGSGPGGRDEEGGRRRGEEEWMGLATSPTRRASREPAPIDPLDAMATAAAVEELLELVVQV
jgi:hypothetical protein